MPPSFFPRQTVEWKIEEPAFIRRLGLSLWAMAITAGLLVRLIRWVVLVTAAPDDWWFVIGSVAVGVVVLVGLATAHLGNFPVSQWMWRAPLFGLVAGATEGAASAILITAGVERIGSEIATWADWPSMALNSVLWDIITVSLFAVVLGVTVQLVRSVLLGRER